MRVVGIMSGTSVDGIDVAVAEIDGNPAMATLAVRQLAFMTTPWDPAIQRHIFALFEGMVSAAELCRANFELANAFAEAVLQMLQAVQIPLGSIALIGSHGQTIWHDVANGRVSSTLQLGDPSVIATHIGVTTVGNFRVADVAAGEQGAPLVSTFDWYLLRPSGGQIKEASGWRSVQNIGGIGNVTFLSPVDSHAEPLAFDTGPDNSLIDWAAQQATNGQVAYDHAGMLAQSRHVAPALLERWLALPYFCQLSPKTTGRELFGSALAKEWWSEAAAAGLPRTDFVERHYDKSLQQEYQE